MEIWKDIIGYEGLYLINENGDVQSVDRYLPAGKHESRIYKGKIKNRLKGNQSGHQKYILWKDNKPKNQYIHRLVAENFIPNPNNYPKVLHIDNDPTNNHVSNLMWGTQKDNMQQMSKEGRWGNQYTK
jgi:hypothetical protein